MNNHQILVLTAKLRWTAVEREIQTGRHIFDSFDVTAHHQNGTLDRFLIEIFLLARLEVGSHDTSLHTGRYFTREHTAESVETTLVRSRYHLRDVHHQRSVRIAILQERRV